NDIQGRHRLIIHSTRRQLPSPLDSERHANAPLPDRVLVTTKGIISRESLLWGPVVAEKEDESGVEKVLCLERLDHLPNNSVQRRYHRSVNSSVWIGDVCDAVHIGLRRSVIR